METPLQLSSLPIRYTSLSAPATGDHVYRRVVENGRTVPGEYIPYSPRYILGAYHFLLLGIGQHVGLA